MPKNTEVKSNRDRYMERLKTKYPDKEFADDEALFGQTNDDYDSYDNELSGYREREKALSDLFASNPRSAAFLTDWRKGEDPIIGMVRKSGMISRPHLKTPKSRRHLQPPIRSLQNASPKRKSTRESIRRTSTRL